MTVHLPAPLIIGTRGSPLALAQARQVAFALAPFIEGTTPGVAAADGGTVIPAGITIETIKTTGDSIQDRPLSEIGGKGLFTKELDVAMLDGRTRLAVHSAKDLPNELPPGLVIAGYLEREDVRDAFISPHAASVDELPAGAVVGTASLRRQAQLLRRRPDLSTVLLRGNVGTRLQRIAEGKVDATLLAMAGLRRLGLADKATAVLSTQTMLPAVGQGAIAIVVRADDGPMRDAVLAIAHPETGVALAVERAFLRLVDGSCRMPIAGLATVDAGRVHFRGLILSPDGKEAVEVERRGTPLEANYIGEDAGREVVATASPALTAHRLA